MTSSLDSLPCSAEATTITTEAIDDGSNLPRDRGTVDGAQFSAVGLSPLKNHGRKCRRKTSWERQREANEGETDSSRCSQQGNIERLGESADGGDTDAMLERIRVADLRRKLLTPPKA